MDTLFTLALNLDALLGDNTIQQEWLENAYPIVISYSATVKDGLGAEAGGEVRNAVFVNDSAVSAVTGSVDESGGGDTPGTGGSGTLMFTVGGTALLAAACTLFVVNRRRPEA